MRTTVLTAVACLAVAPAMAQQMPPSQPKIPQTMPPTQMPPEKIAPSMPSSRTNPDLSQAPSGQPLTPGQPASPTHPVAPPAPDLRPAPGTSGNTH